MRQMSTLQRLLIILLLTVSTPISIAADVKSDDTTATVAEEETTKETIDDNAQEPQISTGNGMTQSILVYD